MSDYVTLVDEIGKYLENEEGKMKKNIFVNFVKVILCLSIIEPIIIYVWNYFRDSYMLYSLNINGNYKYLITNSYNKK